MGYGAQQDGTKVSFPLIRLAGVPGEVLADGIVHCIGIGMAATAAVLVLPKIDNLDAARALALWLYFVSLVFLWCASCAFNLCPVSRMKAHLARIDQAAIFLLIAATYTPFLVIMADTPIGTMAAAGVWTAALAGMAGKLFVPHRFGRVAIPVYAALGWASVFLVPAMAEFVPASAIWLLAGGGVAYTIGIFFHINPGIPFHLAIWHVFVGAGSGMHCLAVCQATGVYA